jgi:hypothetical protein
MCGGAVRTGAHRWLPDPSSGGACAQGNGAMFDAKRWQERAEQSRAQAEQTSDPKAREILLEIARAYEDLAQRAEGRGEKNAFASPGFSLS